MALLSWNFHSIGGGLKTKKNKAVISSIKKNKAGLGVQQDGGGLGRHVLEHGLWAFLMT